MKKRTPSNKAKIEEKLTYIFIYVFLFFSIVNICFTLKLAIWGRFEIFNTGIFYYNESNFKPEIPEKSFFVYTTKFDNLKTNDYVLIENEEKIILAKVNTISETKVNVKINNLDNTDIDKETIIGKYDHISIIINNIAYYLNSPWVYTLLIPPFVLITIKEITEIKELKLKKNNTEKKKHK